MLPQVDVATETVEDQALAIYDDRQAMVRIKGVDDNFSELSHINDILYGDGSFSLHAANLQYGTVGIRLAQTFYEDLCSAEGGTVGYDESGCRLRG